jgi:hypothetical protein
LIEILKRTFHTSKRLGGVIVLITCTIILFHEVLTAIRHADVHFLKSHGYMLGKTVLTYKICGRTRVKFSAILAYQRRRLLADLIIPPEHIPVSTFITFVTPIQTQAVIIRTLLTSRITIHYIPNVTFRTLTPTGPIFILQTMFYRTLLHTGISP